MARNAKELFAGLSEARRKAIFDRADEMFIEEMTLTELRKVRLGSQTELAEKLGIKQAAVSRLERRADMHISRLRKLIGGMGGDLKIVAQFPDRPAVSINLFDALKVVPRTTPAKPPRRRRSAPASVPSVLGRPVRKGPAKITLKIGVAAKTGRVPKKKAHH